MVLCWRAAHVAVTCSAGRDTDTGGPHAWLSRFMLDPAQRSRPVRVVVKRTHRLGIEPNMSKHRVRTIPDNSRCWCCLPVLLPSWAVLASDSASAWLHSFKFKFTGNPYLNPDENVAKCSLATSELDSDHSSHLEPCPSI